MLLKEILLSRLRACGYDLSKLGAGQRAEVERLARAAGIELPRAGVPWPNIAGSDVLAGPLTHVDHGRP